MEFLNKFLFYYSNIFHIIRIFFIYSVENRDGYWQNFFARNSKLRPESGAVSSAPGNSSRSRSGVLDGRRDRRSAAVPKTKSRSETALFPLAETTAMETGRTVDRRRDPSEAKAALEADNHNIRLGCTDLATQGKTLRTIQLMYILYSTLQSSRIHTVCIAFFNLFVFTWQ